MSVPIRPSGPSIMEEYGTVAEVTTHPLNLGSLGGDVGTDTSLTILSSVEVLPVFTARVPPPKTPDSGMTETSHQPPVRLYWL